MKNSFNKQEAVIDLHEKGFTDDFQLIGNDLLWVQGKTFLRREDFSVLESYAFVQKNKTVSSSNFILGIQSLQHNAKGILIQHLANERSTDDLSEHPTEKKNRWENSTACW
jgi:hypothetical protein